MAFGLARFPFVRDLAGFDFKAQPSLDPKQIRELSTGRFIANGETLLLLGPPGTASWCPSRYHLIKPKRFAADRQTADGAGDEHRRFA
jgi:IstB-like ATP binding protein